jgi:hypothetical protein
MKASYQVRKEGKEDSKGTRRCLWVGMTHAVVISRILNHYLQLLSLEMLISW